MMDIAISVGGERGWMRGLVLGFEKLSMVPIAETKQN